MRYPFNTNDITSQCRPGGSCPTCNATEPPEMVHTFTVWEERARPPESRYLGAYKM